MSQRATPPPPGGRTWTRTPRALLKLRDRVRAGRERILGAHGLWSAAFVVVGLLLVGSQRWASNSFDLVVGQLAPHDIRASYDVDVVDEALTAERRREAREQVPDVYVHDAERWMQLGQELGAVFRTGRAALQDATLRGETDPAAVARRRLGGRAPEAVVDALVARGGFSAELERTLTAALTQVSDRLIIGNKALLLREPAIVLLRVPGRRAQRVEDYDSIVDVETARRELEALLATRLALPPREKGTLIDFAQTFLDANVHLDAEATYERREAAAAAVPPIVVRVARGEVLIRKGQAISDEVVERLDAARRDGPVRPAWRELLGWVFVLVILALCASRYCRLHQRHFHRLRHVHALFVLILLSTLVTAQAVLWLAARVVEGLEPPFADLGQYAYLAPVGAGAILVALLANPRVATVYATFAALLFPVVAGGDLYLALWSMIVQLSAVYTISAYRERAALLRAGLIVGSVGAVAVLAVETLRGEAASGSTVLYGAGLAFLGGAVGVGLLVSFSLPPLEWLFNVLTDIRLLELSNANHPLLSRFAVIAPGSYNHSLVVGTLAEEAAKSIGANALLCRVAGFYHDIGKLRHPEYYVENQRGTNPHDRISPSMSALILAAHVKEGVRLAREAGLPEQIVDIIPQHHGTRRMTYFYEKARRLADPDHGPVNEEDFRYPGPKPRTREAAIFMIADAVEAAARTVEDASSGRLHGMIRQVTGAIVLDGQLDECDLTFADLERIQEAFLRLLVSMYHRRVPYPGFDYRRAPSEGSGPRPVARSG